MRWRAMQLVVLQACVAFSACSDDSGVKAVTLEGDAGLGDAGPGDGVGDGVADGVADAGSTENEANAERGRVPPPPPEGVAAVHGLGRALAVSHLFSGATDRVGAPSSAAWREYGWNLDGKITTLGTLEDVANGEPSEVCNPYGQAEWSGLADGSDGIDNSFGANILPVLAGLGIDVDASANDAIAAGDSTLVLDLTNLGEALDDVGIVGKVYAGTDGTAPPRWDGTDVWPVAPESLSEASDITSAKVQFLDSYVAGGTWVGKVDAVLQVQLSVRSQPFSLGVRHPVVAVELGSSPSGVNQGVLGGIVPVDELIREARKLVGYVYPAFCDPAVFDLFADKLRQSADSLADGTQDPTRTCDAVSVGLGFDAITVVRPEAHQLIAELAPSLGTPCESSEGESASGTVGPGCVGVASGCSGFSAGSCSQQDGCSLDLGSSLSTSDDDCRGSAESCSSYSLQESCEDQLGCRWE